MGRREMGIYEVSLTPRHAEQTKEMTGKASNSKKSLQAMIDNDRCAFILCGCVKVLPKL